jgi:Bifunctional DNA primase/polymerase, N-terminal
MSINQATDPVPLRRALAYAAAGWPVFPGRPDNPACAKPRCHECKAPLTRHGFEDATTDPETIRAWWRRWPRANVLIASGAPGPDVLDVDRKPDGDGFAAFNRLKRAGMLTGASMLVRTRSGGVHLYFTGTSQRKGALPRHHLDFQASGGYVIAPPSSVHGCAYEVIDQRPATATFDWSAAKQLLDPPRSPPPRSSRSSPPRSSPGELPPAVIRALEAPAPDRSVALYRLVGACVGTGLDDATVHQLAASYQPALEKYGDRLTAEVDRCLRKIGAA